MKIVFHILTLEPDKIIKNIENKEKKAIEEHRDALVYEKAFSEIGWLPPSQYNLKLPELEDALEQTVVKKWRNIVSVYPMTITPYQENRITWTMNKYDNPKNSITQKYGRIAAYWDAELLYIGFLLKGDVISESEMPIDVSLIGSEKYTLQKLAPNEMLKAIHQTEVAKQSDDLNLDIPLMLPPAWKDMWTVCRQTQFTTICE